MKRIRRSAVLIPVLLLCAAAWGQNANQQCTKENDTRATSGLTGTLTFPDQCGTRTQALEMVVNGSPATVAVTVNGVMPGGTLTPLATSTSTTNTTLFLSAGPFNTYQIVYTLTGGSTPTLTFNRLATTAGMPFSINPGFFGGAMVGQSPWCIVDGTLHRSIGNPDSQNNCVDVLNALGVTGTGYIYSQTPEDLIPTGKQPFIHAGLPFSGFVQLGISLGANGVGTCATSAPLNCWLVSYPVIIPSGLTLEGIDPSQVTTSVNGGTTIAPSATFMQALALTSLGTPNAPACVASGGDGTIPAAGTLYMRAGLVTNASDAPGATGTTPKSQLRGPVSAQSQVTLCGANDSVTWQIGSTPVRGTGTSAQDLVVYAGTDPNNLVEATTVGCSTTAGVADPDGGACRLPIGGGNLTFTITSLLQDTSHTPPESPLVDTAKSFDLSNPEFLLGQGPDTRNSSSAVIKNLSILCNPTNTDVTGANTPSGAILGFTGNEQSGIENVSFYGGCKQYFAYFGFNSNNSHVWGFNAGSSTGPNGTDFSSLVCDARMPTGGCPREIRDGTMGGHDGTHGQSVNMILISGPKAWPVIHDVHTENAGGGCGIKFTNGANGNVITSGHTGGNDSIGGTTVGNAIVCIDGPGVTGGVAAGQVHAVVQSDTNASGKTLIEDASIPSGYGNNNSNNVWVFQSLTPYGIYEYSTNQTIANLGLTSLIYNGVTFANLGTPANGTLRYCTDCTLTCAAGASTGQICERINGTWTH